MVIPLTWSKLIAGFLSFDGRLEVTPANNFSDARIWSDHVTVVTAEFLSYPNVMEPKSCDYLRVVIDESRFCTEYRAQRVSMKVAP